MTAAASLSARDAFCSPSAAITCRQETDYLLRIFLAEIEYTAISGQQDVFYSNICFSTSFL